MCANRKDNRFSRSAEADRSDGIAASEPAVPRRHQEHSARWKAAVSVQSATTDWPAAPGPDCTSVAPRLKRVAPPDRHTGPAYRTATRSTRPWPAAAPISAAQWPGPAATPPPVPASPRVRPPLAMARHAVASHHQYRPHTTVPSSVFIALGNDSPEGQTTRRFWLLAPSPLTGEGGPTKSDRVRVRSNE